MSQARLLVFYTRSSMTNMLENNHWQTWSDDLLSFLMPAHVQSSIQDASVELQHTQAHIQCLLLLFDPRDDFMSHVRLRSKHMKDNSSAFKIEALCRNDLCAFMIEAQ
jgi:hypothetical protein